MMDINWTLSCITIDSLKNIDNDKVKNIWQGMAKLKRQEGDYYSELHDDKLSYQIRPEDKVVQLILEKATIARLQEVDTLDDTERSPGGASSLKEQFTA